MCRHPLTVVTLFALATSLGCRPPPLALPPAAQPEPPADTQPATPEPAPAEVSKADGADLEVKIATFAPVELTADLSALPPSERAALDELIAAARLMDPIFDRQAWAGNPALQARLSDDPSPKARQQLEYVRIMRGPWDRQDHHAPFAVEQARPPGAGFYPEDLTVEEFRRWVAEHPGDAEAFEGLYTVVLRDGPNLIARPYHQAYAQWLEPAAKHLEAAAEKTQNKSLRRFARARAKAFRTDDYYESDKAWMDLDSRIEITIGPYETYEDELLGLKAAYEAFVTVQDPEASKRLERFKRYLPQMEQHLPIPDEVKTKRGRESPIRVVDLVFSAGDARKSVQTIAFNLPNDERVRKEKGAKKVLLRNSIQTKFDAIMKPIGEAVMAPEFHESLSADAFFNEVLFHELSHSLGPAFVGGDAKKGEVRLALGPAYTALEESKADVMGAYNVLFMIEKGEFPPAFRSKILVSYFAGLFRSVRFGVAEAHGRGAAIQINHYLQDGAATFDSEQGQFSMDLDRLEASMGRLVHDLVMLQHAGDKAAAEAFLEQYGRMTPPIEAALTKLEHIPIDIRPVYPVAGESLADLDSAAQDQG